MKARFITALAISVLAISLLPNQVMAQFPSVIDTFKVMDVTAGPGDTTAVKIFVVNDSTGLAGIAMYIKIDTSVIEFIDTVDTYSTPPVTYIDFDLIGRPLEAPPPMFDDIPPVLVANNDPYDSVFAAFIAAGGQSEIAPGRGYFMQFYVRVKEDIPIGTTTLLRMFSPVDDPPHTDPRQCEYSDTTGIMIIRPPTLVSGILTVDTVTIPEENNDPVIYPISPSSYVIEPNQNVNFTVSAYDPDVGDYITLTANNMPMGATFGTAGSVGGITPVNGTFNWTPTETQTGAVVITFTCSDDEGAFAAPRTVTITVQGGAPPVGDFLYTSSSWTYGKPSGGIPGFDEARIPVNLNETVPVYGVQFDFLYDNSVIVMDSVVSTDRMENFTYYDDIGSTPGRIRIVAFGLNNETIQSGTSSEIFNFWGTIRSTATPGEYPIAFENAWEAVSANPSTPSVELEFDTTGVFMVNQKGDVNGDGRIDVADMVIVVGYIIGEYSLDARQFASADMDDNLVVDVIDLQAIVNIVYGGSSPSPGIWDGPSAKLTLGSDDYLIGADNVIEINADLPTTIAGMQLEIRYDPSKVSIAAPTRTALSQNLEFTYRDNGHGKVILLLYSAGKSNYIMAGSGPVLELPIVGAKDISAEDADIKITHAVLADPSATEIPVEGFNRVIVPEQFTLYQNYPNPFNPETIIEFSINPGLAFDQVKLEIFNILGERVNTLLNEPLAAGYYSRRWEGTNFSGQPVASGVYFYRLQVGDLSDTKKMVLMK